MLARASSDAGTRLRRSKSTSSAHRPVPHVVEPFDPDVAQQHALAAATAAFARQTAQDATDRREKHSLEVFRTKSSASRKSLSSQGSHFPPRGSSFRSQNPAQPRQTTSTQSSFRRSTISTDQKLPQFASKFNETPPTRPLSTQLSSTLVDNGRPSTQPKPGRQAAASSITSQQIRKARSMYYASSIQTGSPIARPPAKFLATPASVSTSSNLTASPMSPQTRHTGPSPLSSHRIPITIEPNETVEKARDEYLQAFQQRSVKHKPSLFLAPFRKRQNNGKEKASRTTSGPVSMTPTCEQTPGESVVDITLSDFLPQSDKPDKRSFSGSLKRKIRRVFKRNTSRVPTLPVQQIEASRDYFEASQVSSSCVDGSSGGFEIPSPDDDILQRVRSRISSAEEDHPNLVRASSPSSINESIQSFQCQTNLSQTSASTSRVTSWGTSCTGDTLTQRAIKRLTVIHEAKDSIGSEADRLESLSAKRESLPPPTFTAFRDPMPMEDPTGGTSTPPINPKRMFSALMREIDASKAAKTELSFIDRTPEAESSLFGLDGAKKMHSGGRELHSSASKDPRRSISSDQRPASSRPPSAATQRVPGKKSSIRSFGRAIRSTIRAVTPGEHRSSPCPDPPTAERDTICDSQKNDLTPGSDATSESQEPEDEPRTAIFMGGELEIQAQTGSNSVYTPSAEELEKRANRANERWKTTLEDSNTPQFPRETDRIHVEANPVHRKALTNPANSESPLSRSVMSPLSPSVYSRNTDGLSIFPNDSVVSFENANHGGYIHDGGSAIILNSQSVRSYVIGTPSPDRSRSTRISRDWKAWLSHEISGIETPSQEDLRISDRYATPSRQEHQPAHTSTPKTTCEPLAEPVGDHQIPKMASGERLNEPERVLSVRTIKTNTAIDPITPKESSDQEGVPCSDAEQHRPNPRHSLKSLQQRDHLVSTPPHPLGNVHTPIETPPSARMNDRFPFITTGRRSSSYTSKFSGHSRSPNDSASSSLKAPKVNPSPKVYSDFSGSNTDTALQQVPGAATKTSETQHTSKENVTPNTRGISRSSISHLGRVPRPKSLQPLSPAALNRSPDKMAPNATGTARPGPEKNRYSPVDITIQRNRVRATIRPMSPEKLSRRPKSAFDLRGPRIQGSGSLGETVLPSTPITDRRNPSLYPTKSPGHILLSSGTGPGAKETQIDTAASEEERSGSVTPGQRMADNFLKSRKSATVLERGARKSGVCLVREDTPAFL